MQHSHFLVSPDLFNFRVVGQMGLLFSMVKTELGFDPVRQAVSVRVRRQK